MKTIIFSCLVLLGLNVAYTAETTEAYIPYGTSAEVASFANLLPDMGPNEAARLERMNYFLNDRAVKDLRINPVYAKGNRSRAFQLSHPIKGYLPSSSNVIWADQNVINKFTIQEIIAFVPTQNPNIKTPNPRTKSVNWVWDSSEPNIIRDAVSNEAFPNATYQENKLGYGITPFGEVVSVPYYEDPTYASAPYDVYTSLGGAKDVDVFNGRYYFTAMVDNFKHQWLDKVLNNLSLAYVLTGEQKYAEYVTAILLEYSKNYRYILGARESKDDRMGSYVYNPTIDHRGSTMKLLQRFYRDTGYNVYLNQTKSFTEFYDRVYRDDILNERVPGTNQSARDFIEEKLFTPMIDFAWDTRPTTDDIIGNIADYAFYTAEITLVMGKPDWARMVDEYLKLNTSNGINSSDMISWESPGYHVNWSNNLVNTSLLMSYYQDPEGYVSNGDQEFAISDYRMLRNYGLAMTNPDVFYYPSGQLIAIHDKMNTDWGGKPSDVSPLVQSDNRILTGWGHTNLGVGKTTQQIQAHLHWSGDGSHTHKDALSFNLFANEQELYGDPGYTWEVYGRGQWAHNTALVDGVSQGLAIGDIGNLNFFAPNTPGQSIIRVEQENAYESVISDMGRYRRTIGLNSTEESRPYVIDVFEIKGGSLHEYLMHGSNLQAMNYSTNLTGMTPWTAIPSYYATCDSMKIGELSNNTKVIFSDDSDPTSGVRMHIANTASDSMQLVLGLAPRVFGGKISDNYASVPKLILRNNKTGSDTLNSIFVVVHEPFEKNAAEISSVVKDIIYSGDVPMQLSLTVSFADGRIDYHVLSLKDNEKININDQANMTLGPLTANASYASAITSGTNCDLYMSSGTRASCYSKSLSAPTAIKLGNVVDLQRKFDTDSLDVIVSDISLPLGTSMDHDIVYLDFLNPDGSVAFVNSYEIKEIRPHASGVAIEIYSDIGVDYESGQYVQKMPVEALRQSSSVRIRYMNTLTTVPMAQITPNLGRFERQRATDVMSVYQNTVEVNTRFKNGSVRYGVDQIPQSGIATSHSISLSKIDSIGNTIYAQAENTGGVMVSPLVTQKLRNILPKHTISGLLPGLYSLLSQGGGLVTPDVRVPEIGYSNSDLYTFTGFIEAPVEGIYEFRYIAKNSSLKINNIEIMNTTGLDSDIPWSGTVTLAQGLHPFDMTLSWDPEFQYSLRNIGSFVLQWKAPGDSIYTAVPPSVFFHSPVGNLPSIEIKYSQDLIDTLKYNFSVLSSDDGYGNEILTQQIGWDLDGDERIDFVGLDSLGHYFPVNGTTKISVVGFNDDGERAMDTVSVTVSGIENQYSNNPPLVNDQSLTVEEGTDIAFELDGLDPEGAVLSYNVTSSPIKGNIVGVAPNLEYHSYLGASGKDTLKFTAFDGTDNSLEGIVEFNIIPKTKDADIEISPISPGGASDVIIASEGLQTRQRELARTGTINTVIGQTFKIKSSLDTSKFKLKKIYMKSSSNENFDNFEGAVELKIFDNSTITPLKVAEYRYTMSDFGDGSSQNDISVNDWIGFQLDSGLVLDVGSYSYLMYFDSSNANHRWGFVRDNSGIYADGNQVEGLSYVSANWGVDTWSGVSNNNSDDFMFYITAVGVADQTVQISMPKTPKQSISLKAGEIIIDHSMGKYNSYKISLFDHNAKELMVQEVEELERGSLHVQVNESLKLSSGQYFIQVQLIQKDGVVQTKNFKYLHLQN